MNRYIYILLFAIGIMGFYSVAFAQITVDCNARVRCVCESTNSVRVVSCPANFVNPEIDCTNEGIPQGTCEVNCEQGVEAFCAEIPVECRNNETANCLVTLPIEVGVSGSGCPPGETSCYGQCVDTDSDNTNCGECGNVCDGILQCVTGVCSCPDGLDLCSDQCVDTQSDEENCGECGNTCNRENEACISGSCACPSGFTSCPLGCFSLSDDAENCGECGNQCGSGEICVDSQCLLPGG